MWRGVCGLCVNVCIFTWAIAFGNGGITFGDGHTTGEPPTGHNPFNYYKLAIKFQILCGIPDYFVYLYAEVRGSWSVRRDSSKMPFLMDFPTPRFLASLEMTD
jgi:hypothetical protein